MPNTSARAMVSLLLALASVSGACGGDGRSTAAAGPLVVRIGTFTTQAPGRQTALLAGFLSAEPLVSVGWDGRPVFRLAESAEHDADGREIVVRLRRDAMFHTGEPITASGIRELLLPKVQRFAAGEIQSVTVEDDRTLRLRLNEPYSLKPVDLTDFVLDDDTRPELRTGPFKVISAEGTSAALQKFDRYRGGAPQVERVEIHEYPSLRAAWTAMMRGEVSFLHEVNREAIEFLEGSDIRTYPLLRPYYVLLVFNLKHPVLRRPDVRVALNEAVLRDEVVARGMAGHGRVAEGPFWPHHWAYDAAQYDSVYDPDAARRRLDTAGLREGRPAPDAMPARFRFTCLVPEGDPRFERIALVVQRQLFNVGVDMQLLALPPQELLGRIKGGDYDSFIFEMVSGRTLRMPYRMWHSKSGLVTTGYTAADQALDRMRLARSDAEARSAVADVMDVMRADPPAIFLTMPRDVRAAESSLDIPYEPDRDVFGSLWQATRAASAE